VELKFLFDFISEPGTTWLAVKYKDIILLLTGLPEQNAPTKTIESTPG
jgi:hypothetical protein